VELGLDANIVTTSVLYNSKEISITEMQLSKRALNATCLV